jgi:hypothetical protein
MGAGDFRCAVTFTKVTDTRETIAVKADYSFAPPPRDDDLTQ